MQPVKTSPLRPAKLSRMTLADTAPAASKSPGAKGPPTAFGTGFVLELLLRRR